MFKGSILVFLYLILILHVTRSQELSAHITVNSSRISSQVDKKVFQTLQSALYTFLNNRKWTNDSYQPNEKISCNFLLNIEKAISSDVYQATLTIQGARPVYNSTYETALINHKDDGIVFRYVEYQPLEFNENRVQGTDPSIANLTAVFAYYVYLIIGLDNNSFALRGGDPYFQRAQNIVNNAPEGKDITGWRAFDGVRNRYWLIENITSSRYSLMNDAFYSYYRLGMDHLYDNEVDGRNAILNTLNMINTVNTEIPNSMIVQFFFQGRANELIKVFRQASVEEKSRAMDLLSRVDVANASSYKQELK